MLVCVSFSHFAHGTAGAARIRHSPRPLISRRETFGQTSGGSSRENAKLRLNGASSLRAQRSNPFFLCAARWIASSQVLLAMTDYAKTYAVIVRQHTLTAVSAAQRANRTASRRLCRLQSEPRLDRVAHHELLDLSSHRHRKFVDELDVARDLVVRDLAVTEVANLVGGQRLAGSRPDPCAELLAVTTVGDTEDLNIQDLRMTKQKFLDLARVEVLTAADHHVLDAADDVAITLGIDDRDIAGVHPAAGIEHAGRLFGFVPIAQHDAVATGAQFAPFAARHDASLEIDNLDLDMGMNAPDGGDPTLQRIVRRALKADRAGFGHAVGDGDVAHVHLFVDAPHHLDRAGRAGHDAGAQRRQIEFGKFGMVEFGDEHGRHTIERRALLTLDGLQRRQRIEALAGIDHGCAQRDRSKIAHHHAEAMIERNRNADAVVFGQAHRAARSEEHTSEL